MQIDKTKITVFTESGSHKIYAPKPQKSKSDWSSILGGSKKDKASTTKEKPWWKNSIAGGDRPSKNPGWRNIARPKGGESEKKVLENWKFKYLSKFFINK